MRTIEITLMNQSTPRIIRNKIGLLNLAEELGNVSKACKMMGVSRDTFYRYQTARDEGGVEALLEKSKKGCVHFSSHFHERGNLDPMLRRGAHR